MTTSNSTITDKKVRYEEAIENMRIALEELKVAKSRAEVIVADRKLKKARDEAMEIWKASIKKACGIL